MRVDVCGHIAVPVPSVVVAPTALTDLSLDAPTTTEYECAVQCTGMPNAAQRASLDKAAALTTLRMAIGEIEARTDSTSTGNSSMASHVPSKKTIDTNKSDLMMFMALCDKLVSASERITVMSRQDVEYTNARTKFGLCLDAAIDILEAELTDLRIARSHRVVPQKNACLFPGDGW